MSCRGNGVTGYFLAWIVVVAVTIALASGGTSEMFYRVIETTEGLPDNSVTGLVQSPDGYLWVATEGGLVRSNGTSFTEISLQRFPSVKGRAVKSLIFDLHGQLWVGMERGPLIRLGRHGGRAFTEEDGAYDMTALSMAEDGRGVMWIAYAGGLCRVEGEVVRRYTGEDGLPEGGDFQVTSDGEGKVWFLKGGNLGRIIADRCETVVKIGEAGAKSKIVGSIGSGVWICLGPEIRRFEKGVMSEVLNLLPEGEWAEAMLEDDDGSLFVGTKSSGLYSLKDGELSGVPTSSPDVSCISRDTEGNLWVGTDGGGLNLVRERAISLVRRRDGLPFEVPASVCEGSAGDLWAVGRNGNLARRQNGIWMRVKDFEEGAACVSAGKESGIWVGTHDEGVWNFRGEKWKKLGGSIVGSVRGLYNAKDGSVWIASGDKGGTFRYKDGTFLPVGGFEGQCVAMVESADETIWIATETGSVLAFDGEKFHEIPAISENSPKSARALESTADGSLWIGFAGDGLGRFKDGRLTMITTAEGLMDDYISQIIDDGRGALWIAGNRGLFQVDIVDFDEIGEMKGKKVRSRMFGESEGLPGLQPFRRFFPSTWRTDQGSLLFAMRNGLVIAHPEKIGENPRAPEVLIERVTLDDEPVALYGNRATLMRLTEGTVLDLSLDERLLDVPPDYKKLKFQFAALSFSSPENVHFRYRLQGFEKEWVDAENEHTATYPRLPAGKYVFQVIASNNAGVWNEIGQSLTVKVWPFFWETWWFRIGEWAFVLLAVAGMVLIVQRTKHRRQLVTLAANRAIEEERTRIARDIHDDLGSNLTRIMLLSQPGKGQSTSILPQIHKTSKNLIRTMSEVVWAVNPEQDSLEGLADYLSSYAQDFLAAAGIRCRLEIPVNFPAWKVSAQTRHSLLLAFKEALNNLVKHSGASEARVSLKAENRGFTLAIEDNGKGVRAEDSETVNRSGYGFTSMSERLRKIGGECEIRDSEEGGTVVNFRIRTQV